MRRIITITCTLMLCLATHAQRITASFQGTPLPDVLERLNILQHEYDICAINNELEDFIITADVKDATLHEALAQIVAYYPIRISTKDRTVYVEALSKQLVQYRGVVVGRDSVPLSYATVTLYNPIDTTLLRQAACSNAGVFVVPCPEDSVLARFTHVAHDTLWIKTLQSNLGVVEMHEHNNQLDTMKVVAEERMDRPGVHDAQFPGGERALEEFILRNVQYPKALKTRKDFDVVAQLLVNEDGSVTLGKITKPRNAKEPLVREVKRLIKMMPDWLPATKKNAAGNYVPRKDIVDVTIPFRRYYIHLHDKITVKLSKAGTLDRMLSSEQKNKCTYLEIVGKVNSSDIAVLRHMAGGDGGEGCLKLLDMSRAKIVTDNKMPYLQLDAVENGLTAVSYEDTSEGSSFAEPSYLSTSKNNISFPGHWNYERDASKYHEGWHYKYRQKKDDTLKRVKFFLMGKANGAMSDTRTWYDQENLNKAKLKKKDTRKFRGHELCMTDGRCIYKAYTTSGTYCTDMFYQCPQIQRIIMPADHTEMLGIEVNNLQHRFLK